MPTDQSSDTRRALLEAATTLFAAHGFDGVSLRAITDQAGANIAAVNYHFGSKDGLIAAVLDALIAPLNQERLARLDAVVDENDLEAILRAFVEPVFGALTDPDRARVCLALAARVHLDPERGHALMVEQFAPVVERFHAALTTALPTLPPATLFWRLHLVVGSALHVLQARNGGKLLQAHLGDADAASVIHAAREELLAFALAGMAAPAPITGGA